MINFDVQRQIGNKAQFCTLLDIGRWRADLHPERYLYTFLNNGEGEASSLTFGELDRKARAIAAALQSETGAGERALLVYPPGLEFISAFLACLYAGVVAVPVYPPNPLRMDSSLSRLLGIINDARPVLTLTTSGLLGVKDRLPDLARPWREMRWLATEAVAEELSSAWKHPAVKNETLAFLQYTSGSTATPKGVMVSHGNLLHNQLAIYQAYKQSEDCIGVSWLPAYHDMGLIGMLLQPLYAGFRFVLMSPLDFLQRPFRWLSAISRYKATASGGPNFAYDLCARKVTPEQRESLDLSSWEVAINGAEPIRSQTIERFVKTFGPCGFRRETFCPCYGLAESTLLVTGCSRESPPRAVAVDASALEEHRVVETSGRAGDARVLISSGSPCLDQQIVIVDPETMRRCAECTVGEIWVSSPSVGYGYWGQEEATELAFRAYLADGGKGPFLRTGDLGFVKDGELFVTGRLKDMIIIGGRNFYPHDIEWTVERSHPVLRPGGSAVFSVDRDGEEHLVVLAEVDRCCQPDPHYSRSSDLREAAGQVAHGQSGGHHPDLDKTNGNEHSAAKLMEAIVAIRRGVALEHELPVDTVALLKPATIPKTSSGKIRRYACKSGFLANSLEVLISSDGKVPSKKGSSAPCVTKEMT